jgi:glycosyltransferase involved in cell wall biosynthesis
MSENPFFSIVLATYARGHDIKPTIASVLGQTCSDFELIIVGDGCTDDTEAAVRSFEADRMMWLNLPQNTGSQSFPNNAGMHSSRGRWIAYIGHDDIWAPNHLESMARMVASDDKLDFVVSGCAYHGPEGSETCCITGLFTTPEAPFEHFFPPTSLAHRRDVTTRIGEWRDPRVISPPVDAEFLLRAAHAGLRFASTSEITAHKFAAGHRYLSYLRTSCDEQWAMLRKLKEQSGVDTDDLLRRAKESGQYMAAKHSDYSVYPAGYLFERNRQNKGISRPALQPLRGRVVIEQTEEFRALDWYSVELAGKRYRWSGPNPRPKILIPYTGDRARISIEMIMKSPSAEFSEISLQVERRAVECRIETVAGRFGRLTADIPLAPADYTVLTMCTPMFRPSEAGRSEDTRRLGIAVADIVIEPRGDLLA